MPNELVSDERLAEMLADAQSEADRKPRDETVYDFEPAEAVAAFSELQQSRASVVTPEMVERVRDAYDKVKLWPETRMPGVDVSTLGAGFMDLLDLRNLMPEVIASLSVSHETAPSRTVYVAVDHTGCIHSDEDMERVISIAKANEASVKQARVSHETGDGETQAGLTLTDETEASWRNLALQFDGHRIYALSMLRYAVRNIEEYATVRDILREPLGELKAFLAKPPLSGEAVLAQRIAALAALPAPTDETQGVKRKVTAYIPEPISSISCQMVPVTVQTPPNITRWVSLSQLEAVERERDEARKEIEAAKNDLRSFMTTFVREHFPNVPQWEPLPDLLGMLSQMDNASTVARALTARTETAEASLALHQTALAAAKLLIENLFQHEGAEGFSASTAQLKNEYDAALTALQKL